MRNRAGNVEARARQSHLVLPQATEAQIKASLDAGAVLMLRLVLGPVQAMVPDLRLDGLHTDGARMAARLDGR